MFRLHRFSLLLFALAVLIADSRGDDRPASSEPAPVGNGTRVYGEWRIRVKPDKGPDYNRLIEQSGLPLFREAGGRLIGWWHTLIGDLYEHVTLWEYDDMAAYEHAHRMPLEKPGLRPVRRYARPALIRRGEPIPAAGSRGCACFAT